MFEPQETLPADPQELQRIHQRAPAGALAVAGIATAVVFAIWLAFYLAVFLPRGLQQ
jgi:hypothetical protein